MTNGRIGAQDGLVVLVGYSYGGAWSPRRAPIRTAGLAYIAAFAPTPASRSTA